MNCQRIALVLHMALASLTRRSMSVGVPRASMIGKRSKWSDLTRLGCQSCWSYRTMSMEWRLMLEVLQEVGDAELLKRSDDRCYGAKQGLKEKRRSLLWCKARPVSRAQ